MGHSFSNRRKLHVLLFSVFSCHLNLVAANPTKTNRKFPFFAQIGVSVLLTVRKQLISSCLSENSTANFCPIHIFSYNQTFWVPLQLKPKQKSKLAKFQRKTHRILKSMKVAKMAPFCILS